MTDDRAAEAAMVLATLDSEDAGGQLLRSIVRTAQTMFGATASSIAKVDRATEELVLEAVARDGEQWLVGHRFPLSAGIAGWVVQAGEPMVADNLSDSTLFAREVADATGYVPTALMAAPVRYTGEVIGVLEVMDYVKPSIAALDAVELLTHLADQAAVALTVLSRARLARELLAGEATDSAYADLLPVLSDLVNLDPERRAAGIALLSSVGVLMR
jgi:GAF domain-containing protein